MKQHNCDICGSEEYIEVPHAKEYTNGQNVSICKKCGFVYVRNRRTEQEIADSWTNEIYGEGYTAMLPAIKARQTFVAEFLETSIGLKDKQVLEIGAGEGQFLGMVKNQYKGYVSGIEPSKQNADKIVKDLRISCYNGTINTFYENRKSNHFDIITIMWTLENCVSCVDMLKIANNLLFKDGHICIATGSRILVPFKKPLDYYFGKYPVDTHCFRFSANSLKNLLEVTGFELVKINRYIDSDILCVIAKKRNGYKDPELTFDNYKGVAAFFERWHEESQYYQK